MQISKTILTFCVLAACAVPAVFADPDSEAQAKAREALMRTLIALWATNETNALVPQL